LTGEDAAGRLLPTAAGFFPLYPLLVRAADVVLPGGAPTAAVVVATATGASATVLVAVLAERLGRHARAAGSGSGPVQADADLGVRAAALFSFAPGAFVLSMAYAEGLLLTAAAACLLALLDRRWVLAGVAAALAGATRPPGAVLVVCCAWAAVQELRGRPSGRPSGGERKGGERKGGERKGADRRALLAPVLAPIGLLAYFTYLWRETGDPGYWFRVEREVWRERVDLGRNTVERALDVVGDPLGESGELILALGLLFTVVAGVLLVRLRPPAPVLLFTAGVLGLSLASATLGARPRFVLAAFPLVIAVAARARGVAFSVLLGASAASMPLLLVFYSKGFFELVPGAPQP